MEIGHIAPIGEIAAGALGAALNHMAGQGALGQFVIVVLGPAEFVHQRPQYHGGISNTAGEYDVGTGIQGRLDRQGAQVGIHGNGHGGQGSAAIHFRHIGKIIAARIQVVAFHQGNFHLDAGSLEDFLQGLSAGPRVHPASIADDFYVFCFDVLGQRRHDIVDEVVGVAGAGVLHACPGHDGQGDLGQVIEHQIIDLGLLDQLESGAVGITPESGGAADTNGLGHDGSICV